MFTCIYSLAVKWIHSQETTLSGKQPSQKGFCFLLKRVFSNLGSKLFPFRLDPFSEWTFFFARKQTAEHTSSVHSHLEYFFCMF